LVLEIENSGNRYRGRLEIIRDILLVVKNRKKTKKTRVMYGANLSYKLLTEYLGVILSAGLLEYDGESYYTITDRGKKFLELCQDYEEKRLDLERRSNSLKNGRENLKKMLEPQKTA